VGARGAGSPPCKGIPTIPAAILTPTGDTVGSGPFGSIYLVAIRGVVYAVKRTLTHSLSVDGEALARELAIYNRVHRHPHPHITPLYGVCTDHQDGQLRLVMRRAVCSLEELLKEARGQVGGWMLLFQLVCCSMPAVTLLTRLTPLANRFCHAYFHQGGLTLGQGLHVSVQVLTGVQHLHRLGVVHRDLRTASILVEGRDPLHVMVAGFGLSHAMIPLSDVVGVLGDEGQQMVETGEMLSGLAAVCKWGVRTLLPSLV
jgi:serine/threonine protein kinase